MFRKIFKFLNLLRDPLFVRPLTIGVGAGIEHQRVLTSFPQLAHIVDIGANRGQFALICRKLFPSATISAFEPLPDPCALFRRVFENDTGTRLYPVAIGPYQGWCEMHISARDDSSSLLPISVLQAQVFPGTEEISTLYVQVGPLDTFVKVDDIQEPALLKLDVQGFEFEALLGCQSALSKFAWVYCECSFVELYSEQRLAAEVVEWLAQQGFHIQGIYNPSYDSQGRAVQADFLFHKG